MSRQARVGDCSAAAEMLASAAACNTLVTLCGAGMSAGAIPTAPEMVKEMQERFGESSPALKGLDRFAKGAFAEAMSLSFGGEGGFRHRRAFVADQVFRAVPTAAHRFLAQLCGAGCVQIVLTTNFDSLLEVAVSQRAERNIKVHVYPESLPTSGDGSECVHVVKLHGDPYFEDLGNLVEEMDARTDSDMRRAVLSLLENQLLLILGYGYGDVNVMRLMDEAARSGRLAGLVCAGYTQEDLRAAQKLIDAASSSGTPVAVACPESASETLPASELLGTLVDRTNIPNRKAPSFGIRRGSAGFAEWLPRFANIGLHHPPMPSGRADERDVKVLKEAGSLRSRMLR